MVRFISGNRLASRQAAEQEAAILQELSDLPYILAYRGHITASRACFLFTECAPRPVAGAVAHLAPHAPRWHRCLRPAGVCAGCCRASP